MQHIDIINAVTDLGVCIDGAKLGAEALTKELNNKNIHEIYTVKSKEVEKECSKENKKKNLEPLNEFNERLYHRVEKSIEDKKFPITVGGDHSIAIASALASIKKHTNLGIIWIDAHGDYNTFETTVTGNIHGLPLAAITGYEKNYLTNFHTGNKYNYYNTVIVGGRDIDKLEKVNLEDAGVKVFSTEDIHEQGMKNIMSEAIKIASNGTNGIHISYDLDVIDPKLAPGVSVPAKDGINLEEAYEVVDEIIKHKEIIKSIDLVEYNPKFDVEGKTRKIAIKILEELINAHWKNCIIVL